MTAELATEGRPRRRWPLLAIGASAGTATWSGWVGLGELTGFGIVHPLPGIADSFTINTAVTLPIGVEAYAMYALSIATTSRPLPDRTRRYAWASSAAALILGMAGQIAYHLMTARQPARSTPQGIAPWWVIALVSCLPVVVLGAASLLWHLAGEPAPFTSQAPDVAEPATQPEADDEPVTSEEPSSPQPSTRRPSAAAAVTARPDDVVRVRDAIASGQLAHRPTAVSIRELLAISPAYARAARDAITAREASESTDSAPPKNPAIREVSQQHQHDEQSSKKAPQEVSSTTEADRDEESPRNDEVHHTYATQLT